jgi:hypothetical protein
MPSLTTLLLADAIGKAEPPVAGDKPALWATAQHRKAQPPQFQQQQPEPPPMTREDIDREKAANSAADRARDLRHRAREKSYNALELDNSKEAHAKAAIAHRIAAAASAAAKNKTDNPRFKQEFRNYQHEHNLHAAYHEKMSHSSEDDRKASADKRS